MSDVYIGRTLIFGQPFVKRFALWYRSVVCPVCSVRALWPNGWTDQDETWHAGRPRPCPHCVRWGPSCPQFSTNVYSGQTAGWIKMPFGTEVGLSLGDIVLDGDPAPPQKGHSPQIFGPCLLWPNGWMYQDATWYRCRPWPKAHCVRWGPGFPRTERGTAAPPFFGPCLLWPNGWPSQQVLSSCYIMYKAFLGNS